MLGSASMAPLTGPRMETVLFCGGPLSESLLEGTHTPTFRPTSTRSRLWPRLRSPEGVRRTPEVLCSWTLQTDLCSGPRRPDIAVETPPGTTYILFLKSDLAWKGRSFSLADVW